MPQSHKNRIIFAFACVYFFWGSTYGAMHIAGLHLAPPLVGAARTLLSTVLFCLICFARGTSLRIPFSTAWRLMLVGVLFMSVNNVLLIWAETKVPTGFSALVIAMIPIFIALMEATLPGGERLNLRGWFGTLLGVIGILILLWSSLHRAGPAGNRTLFGFGILMFAALVFAFGSVLSRRFNFQVDTFVATAWEIGAAALANLLVAAAGGTFHTAHWTREGVLSIAYLSVFGSIIGLTAYTYLLQNVPVTKVATYAFVNPVIAVLLGILLFHERLAHTELAGTVIIVAAVATVILSRTKTTPPPSNPMLEIPIEE